jgi:hypothetical protein
MGTMPIDFLFSRYCEPAFTTTDHAGIGEGTGLARSSGPSEQLLNMLEFINRYHRYVFSRICFPVSLEHASVEGIGEYPVGGAQR